MLTVAALYKFMPLDDRDALREQLYHLCRAQGVKGTILLAPEGINGTIAGEEANIAVTIAGIKTITGCADIDVKYARADAPPFLRLKIRMKREIVTMGVPDIDPTKQAGTYLDAVAWNAVLDDPNVVLIDTRNDYEVALGSFPNALDPKTQSFSDLPKWLDAFIASLPADLPKPKIAMFCTGGIRCEKSTALMRTRGLDDVVHLKGGILQYLEDVTPEESKWQGDCFVFDQRVTVGQGLATGDYKLCYACRMPVSPADRASDVYEPGVRCPKCAFTKDPVQLARYAERQRQVVRAKERGQRHLGEQVIIHEAEGKLADAEQ